MTHEQAVELVHVLYCSGAGESLPDDVEKAVEVIAVGVWKKKKMQSVELVAAFLEQWAAALRADE